MFVGKTGQRAENRHHAIMGGGANPRGVGWGMPATLGCAHLLHSYDLNVGEEDGFWGSDLGAAHKE
jgi:hypothetical protein